MPIDLQPLVKAILAKYVLPLDGDHSVRAGFRVVPGFVATEWGLALDQG